MASAVKNPLSCSLLRNMQAVGLVHEILKVMITESTKFVNFGLLVYCEQFFYLLSLFLLAKFCINLQLQSFFLRL